jgi:hypothetical protein
VFESFADAFTARKLNIIGVSFGLKSVHQPLINLSALDNETWRYYMQATLTEEGWPCLILDKGRPALYVKWKRAIDVTNHLPRDLIASLEAGRTYGLREIGEMYGSEAVNIIRRRPPELLVAECRELARRHRPQIPAWSWPKPVPLDVRKTRNGRVVADWVVNILKRDLVETIHGYYGMLAGTWKAHVFESYYDFYMKHRDVKLTAKELEEFDTLRGKFSQGPTEDWVNRKWREYFGEGESVAA